MKFSHSPQLDIVDLGRADYAETTAKMLAMVDDIVAGKRPDTVIVAEFDSVLTVGRGAKPDAYAKLEIPIHEISRGGKVTYHGPGQLVVYPLIALKNEARDLHAFLHAIEEVLIKTVSEFGLPGVRDNRNTGCWVNQQKLASIGVAVRKWVTYHGAALNVNTDLSWFGRFDPCGLSPELMTSMQQQLGAEIDIDEVKRALLSHLQQVLTDYHR
ncbi:MAG: lipoyl(octanoyl) transferase LipB [Planctomycetota bacterium]|jgi:lipoate-protein ligase B|nr:lipoyl(octanoyl) transferase LipB [Planctomycetota bacterium]